MSNEPATAQLRAVGVYRVRDHDVRRVPARAEDDALSRSRLLPVIAAHDGRHWRQPTVR